MTISAHGGIKQVTGGGGIGDEFRLLIHSDTTDGSTTFVDSSPDARTITSYGMSHSTDYAKFGASSIPLAGTAHCEIPFDDYTIGTGDFCVDLWLFPHLSGSVVFDILKILNGNGLHFSVSNTGGVMGNVANSFLYTTVATLTADTWNHFALIRRSGCVGILVNGVLKYKSNATTYAGSIASGDLIFGYFGGFSGEMPSDEIAIRDICPAGWDFTGYSVGQQVFTPPTAPYGS
jgi:hypothetical protein